MPLKELGRVSQIWEPTTHVYIYDHVGREVGHAKVGELPWTVMYLLGGHSKKHLFNFGRRPEVSYMVESVQQLINQIKWWSVQGTYRPPWWSTKVGAYKTSRCTQVVEPTFAAMCGDLSRTLRGKLQSLVKLSHHTRK